MVELPAVSDERDPSAPITGQLNSYLGESENIASYCTDPKHHLRLRTPLSRIYHDSCWFGTKFSNYSWISKAHHANDSHGGSDGVDVEIRAI